MKKWIVRVQVPMKQPFWIGNVEAKDRPQAKRQCRNFVAQHLPLDTKILGIAEGEIVIHQKGPEFTLEDQDEVAA